MFHGNMRDGFRLFVMWIAERSKRSVLQEVSR